MGDLVLFYSLVGLLGFGRYGYVVGVLEYCY